VSAQFARWVDSCISLGTGCEYCTRGTVWEVTSVTNAECVFYDEHTSVVSMRGHAPQTALAHAHGKDLTLKQAALKLGFVTEAEFDKIVDPKKMAAPYVAHR
jgi:hypothetical protein